MMVEQAIARLWSRIRMLVGRSRLMLVDDSQAIQTVQLRLLADETRDQALRAAEYGFCSNPPDGTDAISLHMAGERGIVVVIATNNQTFRMRGLATGEVAIHDDKGRFVYLSAAGIHVQGKDDPILVETTSDITARAGGDVVATAGGSITGTATADITLHAGGTIKLQAPTVEIDSTTLVVNTTTMAVNATTVTTIAAGAVVTTAPALAITGAVAIVGATEVTGTTTLVGDASVSGAMTNNGHDIGQNHEHLPGTFKVGATSVTGVSGAVTP